jgi:hypothetical protein
MWLIEWLIIFKGGFNEDGLVPGVFVTSCEQLINTLKLMEDETGSSN